MLACLSDSGAVIGVAAPAQRPQRPLSYLGFPGAIMLLHGRPDAVTPPQDMEPVSLIETMLARRRGAPVRLGLVVGNLVASTSVGVDAMDVRVWRRFRLLGF